ncbi:Spc98 family-domain-containing protein [Pelagophyceae sp. CCMP2097]|nr:Spc98 family-domain-containing protein [Pelagophyceae sp. CCMP2097]
MVVSLLRDLRCSVVGRAPPRRPFDAYELLLAEDLNADRDDANDRCEQRLSAVCLALRRGGHDAHASNVERRAESIPDSLKQLLVCLAATAPQKPAELPRGRFEGVAAEREDEQFDFRAQKPTLARDLFSLADLDGAVSLVARSQKDETRHDAAPTAAPPAASPPAADDDDTAQTPAEAACIDDGRIRIGWDQFGPREWTGVSVQRSTSAAAFRARFAQLYGVVLEGSSGGRSLAADCLLAIVGIVSPSFDVFDGAVSPAVSVCGPLVLAKSLKRPLRPKSMLDTFSATGTQFLALQSLAHNAGRSECGKCSRAFSNKLGEILLEMTDATLKLQSSDAKIQPQPADGRAEPRSLCEVYTTTLAARRAISSLFHALCGAGWLRSGAALVDRLDALADAEGLVSDGGSLHASLNRLVGAAQRPYLDFLDRWLAGDAEMAHDRVGEFAVYSKPFSNDLKADGGAFFFDRAFSKSICLLEASDEAVPADRLAERLALQLPKSLLSTLSKLPRRAILEAGAQQRFLRFFAEHSPGAARRAAAVGEKAHRKVSKGAKSTFVDRAASSQPRRSVQEVDDDEIAAPTEPRRVDDAVLHEADDPLASGLTIVEGAEGSKASSPKSVLLGPRADADGRAPGGVFAALAPLGKAAATAANLIGVSVLGAPLSGDADVSAAAKRILTDRYGSLMRRAEARERGAMWRTKRLDAIKSKRRALSLLVTEDRKAWVDEARSMQLLNMGLDDDALQHASSLGPSAVDETPAVDSVVALPAAGTSTAMARALRGGGVDAALKPSIRVAQRPGGDSSAMEGVFYDDALVVPRPSVKLHGLREDAAADGTKTLLYGLQPAVCQIEGGPSSEGPSPEALPAAEVLLPAAGAPPPAAVVLLPAAGARCGALALLAEADSMAAFFQAEAGIEAAVIKAGESAHLASLDAEASADLARAFASAASDAGRDFAVFEATQTAEKAFSAAADAAASATAGAAAAAASHELLCTSDASEFDDGSVEAPAVLDMDARISLIGAAAVSLMEGGPEPLMQHLVVLRQHLLGGSGSQLGAFVARVVAVAPVGTTWEASRRKHVQNFDPDQALEASLAQSGLGATRQTCLKCLRYTKSRDGSQPRLLGGLPKGETRRCVAELDVVYKAPWPVGVVLTPFVLQTYYYPLHTSLLEAKDAALALDGLFANHDRKTPPSRKGVAFRFELRHALNAIDAYLSAAIEAEWVAFSKSVVHAQSLAALYAQHLNFIRAAHKRCFLDAADDSVRIQAQIGLVRRAALKWAASVSACAPSAPSAAAIFDQRHEFVRALQALGGLVQARDGASRRADGILAQLRANLDTATRAAAGHGRRRRV